MLPTGATPHVVLPINILELTDLFPFGYNARGDGTFTFDELKSK